MFLVSKEKNHVTLARRIFLKGSMEIFKIVFIVN